MRYEEDHIRLYSPVLRRIVMLMAVIAAVPVVLWTITTFVRSYVAPPRGPTFHAVTATASITAPKRTAANTGAGTPSADSDDSVIPSGRSPPVVQASVTTTEPRSTTPGMNPAVDGQQSDAVVDASTGTTTNPTGADRLKPSMPPPAFAGPSSASRAPVSVAAAGPQRADTSPDPAPNVTPPDRDQGQQRVADQAATSTASTADSLPAPDPLTGRIPLPRHRPRLFAMAQQGLPTSIPIPRPRPATAPEAAPTTGGDAPFSRANDPYMQ
jgi:hypothetical protein